MPSLLLPLEVTFWHKYHSLSHTLSLTLSPTHTHMLEGHRSQWSGLPCASCCCPSCPSGGAGKHLVDSSARVRFPSPRREVSMSGPYL